MPQAYTNAFRSPMRAEIDRDAYSNSLLKNDVARIPQRNRAEDVQMQGQEQALNEQQKATAAGLLATRFAAGAQSPSPKAFAQQFLRDPNFQAAGKLLGLPVEQFTVSDTDTDDAMRQSMSDWANALGQGQQARVQSTQVLEDGTIAYVTSDGQLVRTGEKARNPLQAIEVAGGRAAFDPRSGQTRPITTAQQETEAAANLKRAETEAVQGVVPADARVAAAAKSPRLAAAARRLERVSAASQALGDSGGPVEGRLRSAVGTPVAQELEAANAQLINELTALTRIPGVGSQSDLEQRLAQLALPNASQHPAVRARSIQELEAFLTDLGAALDSVSSGQGAQGIPDFSTMSEADLMRIINGQ